MTLSAFITFLAEDRFLSDAIKADIYKLKEHFDGKFTSHDWNEIDTHPGMFFSYASSRE